MAVLLGLLASHAPAQVPKPQTQPQPQEGIPPAFGDPWANSHWHPMASAPFQWIWMQQGAAYLRTCIVDIESTDGQNHVQDFELHWTGLDGTAQTDTIKSYSAGPKGVVNPQDAGRLAFVGGGGLGTPGCLHMDDVTLAGAQLSYTFDGPSLHQDFQISAGRVSGSERMRDDASGDNVTDSFTFALADVRFGDPVPFGGYWETIAQCIRGDKCVAFHGSYGDQTDASMDLAFRSKEDVQAFVSAATKPATKPLTPLQKKLQELLNPKP